MNVEETSEPVSCEHCGKVEEDADEIDERGLCSECQVLACCPNCGEFTAGAPCSECDIDDDDLEDEDELADE